MFQRSFYNNKKRYVFHWHWTHNNDLKMFYDRVRVYKETWRFSSYNFVFFPFRGYYQAILLMRSAITIHLDQKSTFWYVQQSLIKFFEILSVFSTPLYPEAYRMLSQNIFLLLIKQGCCIFYGIPLCLEAYTMLSQNLWHLSSNRSLLWHTFALNGIKRVKHFF